ncbi:dethiobiotin synthase [Poseidonibacter ostreae]|jgi:dethiobiotin synthetase|uniref:ATP-dependent dethiobiotin synthetase BioD n=1 Tax=Poseidonibacter ostreae TaxID=2654171 RepID=A0A6L4WUR0_9BACT|nr:dethiobiotin synthase [Poseidonibacter ostreae]KAB7885392.1 dethiobiotin synthase [Poseidonibacter ostreae]KAB7890346.1 dethiobiotin synthase [Poseidonibacter ostreae]KAB7890576.1 dethiobiotin synthase [Poseidonibacter ostreae]
MNKEINYYKNKSIFISATNTDVGKTYACEKFLRYFASKGFKVGYFKPCETGVVNEPIDGSKMLKLTKELNPQFNVSIEDVVPYQFKLPAAPYVAKEKTTISLDFLKKKKEYLSSLCDILIIEGAGGLLVPLEEDLFIIDLIKEFESECILITPSKLGCINDTLLSIEALKNRDIDFEFYINLYKDKNDFEKVSKPFLQKYFKKLSFLQEI